MRGTEANEFSSCERLAAYLADITNQIISTNETMYNCDVILNFTSLNLTLTSGRNPSLYEPSSICTDSNCEMSKM